ncbi:MULTISPECIES: oxygenase MpaB family protein [unclassified Serratia (in: enterobacteria)]|uniref:oxygenase MpaB family protein n=1 Tax=unclassified Serratia (in: enterobacteria) TaxID=2647522 RepID=UPI000503435A|nr:MULTISPECIES: oxygenase MpaB family protein [unclassified Serratia (in: enterobacteria)]KFK95556.1 histidine kinase [Serratia sp. Ag2]KFL00430.1 histidine kinase [Serratia sp. Ag1]
MEALRTAIEKQVLSLTGLALGGIDFENPPGDPGLFGPQSVTWQVHSDFTAMLCGGVSALLLQMLHPLALAGVWDHSNFREDMLGRLCRTSQFISVTSFGPTAEAERLIAKVKAIHLQVTGTGNRGEPYAASDPSLLTWVHVAESSRFLASYLRYRNPHLSPARQDAYYQEAARVAEALGARDVPTSCAAVADYLQQMRPQLICDERTLAVVRILLAAPVPSALARPFGALVMQAGIDLLPNWAQQQLGFTLGKAKRRLVRVGVRGVARVLRAAVRNGAYPRAVRRMAKTVD